MNMSKRAVTAVIVGFHIVTFGAVFLRIDTFPLTWVPMYSLFHGEQDLTVPVGNKIKTKRGFKAVTTSGEIEFIAQKDLNIPKAAFRRIYYERAFGKGPPKHLRERVQLNSVSNAIFDLWYPDPATSVDWGPRLLNMLNETLDRKIGDENYITEVTAVSDFAVLPRDQRREGDLSNLNIVQKKSVIRNEGKSHE